MERKVEITRASGKAAAPKTPPVTIGPFSSIAEPIPVKTRTERSSAAARKANGPAIKPAKKPAAQFLDPAGTDPFAETADNAGPAEETLAPRVRTGKKKTVISKDSVPAESVAKAARPAKKAAPKTVAAIKAKFQASPDVPVIEPIADPEPNPAPEPVILPPTDPTDDPVPEPIIEPSPEPPENPDPAPVTDPPMGLEPEFSAAFKLLAEPTLPELSRKNRARLQMQTPTRIYLYWSVKDNPWATLRGVFGSDIGSYTLVVKLIDKSTGREDIRPIEAEGNFWFDVEPDRSYQAEIGFYAVNRPYFRVLYSNTVETPRSSPSPRAATESDWRLTSAKFAEVLDVAGFSRDAVDVAMAGDDHAAAADNSHRAFSTMLGTAEYSSDSVTAEDIRYAMLALAAGQALEELKFTISASLFALLQSNAASIEPTKAMNALTQYFDIDEADFAEEQFGPAVFGASLVNFPRTLRTKTLSPKYAPRYNPVSSHSVR